MNPSNRLLVAFAFVLTALSSMASEYSGVAVNGEWLTREQLYVFQVRLGTAIPMGNYLFDGSGCWLNLNDDTSGCVGGVSPYFQPEGDSWRGDRDGNYSVDGDPIAADDAIGGSDPDRTVGVVRVVVNG